jgi:putative oxidoreductase
MNTIHTASTNPAGFRRRGLGLWGLLTRSLDLLQPAAALLARLYIAQVFFLSGLTKLRDWEITVALFTDEYKVPLLPPALAAALGRRAKSPCPCCWCWAWAGASRPWACSW